MHDLSALVNRLKKNQRSLASWLKQYQVTCYRLYDVDIPELRFIVDRYEDHIVIYDKFDDQHADHMPAVQDVIAAVAECIGVAKENIHFKERRRMAGANQYERIAETEAEHPVNEGSRKYLVNLNDYLDTGLFLDHRPIRDLFQKTPQGRFLNLFCYTAAVSVAAALGGAETVSVDMSNKYIDWAKENFRLNGLNTEAHTFVREDALKFLKEPGRYSGAFDTVFLDPPTFSNSKKMDQSFDVQRDHEQLINLTMKFLKKNGVLYFSCNRSKFRLGDQVAKKFHVEDITEASIPKDFRNRKIHVCFKITKALA